MAQHARISVGTLTAARQDRLQEFLDERTAGRVETYSTEVTPAGVVTVNLAGPDAHAVATEIAERLSTLTSRSITATTVAKEQSKVRTAAERREELNK